MISTRQVWRHDLYLRAMTYINKVAGGEPRKIRRAMARDLAKKDWRNRGMTMEESGWANGPLRG